MHRSLMLLSAAVSTLVLCSGVLYPASGHAETLDAAVATALNQHPTVLAALAERDIAKQMEREKYSDYFPQLNANAAAGRVYGDNSTSRGLTSTRGAGYSNMGEGSVSMRETIFDGMQTVNHVSAARERVESANDNIVDVRENLALRAVLAYMDVLRSRDSVAMIREHNNKIADYRGRIEKMVEDGGADLSMAVQAHDIQNQLDSTLADVEGQLNKAMAEYNEVMGHPVSEPMLRPAVAAGTLPNDAETAVRAALETHPALRGAMNAGDAAEHDIRAEKGTLYPSLLGEVSYYKKDIADLIGGEVTDGRALVRMNWDFSTGGAQLAKIRQARERKVQTMAQTADLSGRIEREIRKAYAELDAAKTRLAVSTDRTAISKDLVATYEKQFEAAKVTLLNLLQAENTDFNARLSLLNADYRFQAAQYSVLANTGHLQGALNIETAQKTAEKLSPKTTGSALPVNPMAKAEPVNAPSPPAMPVTAVIAEKETVFAPAVPEPIITNVRPMAETPAPRVTEIQAVAAPVDVAPVVNVKTPAFVQVRPVTVAPPAQDSAAMRAKWLGHE